MVPNAASGVTLFRRAVTPLRTASGSRASPRV